MGRLAFALIVRIPTVLLVRVLRSACAFTFLLALAAFAASFHGAGPRYLQCIDPVQELRRV